MVTVGCGSTVCVRPLKLPAAQPLVAANEAVTAWLPVGRVEVVKVTDPPDAPGRAELVSRCAFPGRW